MSPRKAPEDCPLNGTQESETVDNQPAHRRSLDDAVRISLLEQKFELLGDRLDKIEKSIEDLKGQMTKVLVVVALLAGLAGAGGKAAVGALLGVPISERAQADQVAHPQPNP